MAPLDWTDPSHDDSIESLHSFTHLVPYDIILLADCVFAVELCEDLVRTILRYSGPKSTVLCCHEIRDESANQFFLEVLSRYFHIKKVPKSRLNPEYSNHLVEILICKPLRIKTEKTNGDEPK